MDIIPDPNNMRMAIAGDALRDLYIEQGLTLEKVAHQFGVSPTTIRRRFRDVGISARARGPEPKHWGASRPGRTIAPFEWTSDLAHVIGLIATDGCLSKNGRAIVITSKDLDLLQSARNCLGGRGSINLTSNGRGQWCHRYQLTSRRLYLWLLSIGLMPAKSLRLDALDVPDDVFPDFMRGCIDGDGSIVTYVDRYNTTKDPKYVYDRLYVSLVSASPPFLRWIQHTVFRLSKLTGHLTVRRNPKHHDLWRLRYAKRESAALLKWMYYAPDVAALRRKREHAQRALVGATWYRHPLADFDAR